MCVACGSTQDLVGGSPDASVTVPVDTSCVTQILGPAGGTLSHPAGASLSVPVGALVQATSLTLCGVPEPAAGALEATPLGQAFQAGPEGQQFSKPVQVVVPFQAALLPAGARAAVFMSPNATTNFVALVSDASAPSGFAMASTVHFSQFVPAIATTSLSVSPAPTLPNGTVGSLYAQEIDPSGGTPPYSFTVSPESTLPAGLLLSPDGHLTGTPTTAGVYAFFVQVADSNDDSVDVGEAMTVLEAVNPVPELTSVTPDSAAAGSADLTIALEGSGFAPNAQALWDGAPLATAFGSTAFLGATIPQTDLVAAGAHTITVINPVPGGGASDEVSFSVEAVAGGTDGGPSDAGSADGSADGGSGDATSQGSSGGASIDGAVEAGSEESGTEADATGQSGSEESGTEGDATGQGDDDAGEGGVTCGPFGQCANGTCLDPNNNDPLNCGGCGPCLAVYSSAWGGDGGVVSGSLACQNGQCICNSYFCMPPTNFCCYPHGQTLNQEEPATCQPATFETACVQLAQ